MDMETRLNLQKIRDIAKDKNITLASISRAAGISQMGLQKIINDNSAKIQTLEKIAEYMGVTIMEFFDQDPSVASMTATNSNCGSVGGDFSVNEDIGRVLDILHEQLKVKDEQLKVKDEQIKGLISALSK